MADSYDLDLGLQGEITEAMMAAALEALRKTVPLDLAEPVLCEEDIIRAIYTALRRADSRT